VTELIPSQYFDRADLSTAVFYQIVAHELVLWNVDYDVVVDNSAGRFEGLIRAESCVNPVFWMQTLT
jgi:hypothetical protein